MTFKVLRTEGVGLGPRLLFSIGCRFGSLKRHFDGDFAGKTRDNERQREKGVRSND
jgi:hypothetical protein